MSDINQVTLVGRIADEEGANVRIVKGDTKLATFTIATGTKSGDKEYTEFHRCSAWAWVADACEGLAKGDLVMGIGRLQTRSWLNDEGKKIYRTEVVLNIIGKQESAQKKTLAPPQKQPTWPYYDAEHKVDWPEPVDGESSYTEVSGKQVCAIWTDASAPWRGGFAYKWEDSNQDWEEWGQIDSDPTGW